MPALSHRRRRTCWITPQNPWCCVHRVHTKKQGRFPLCSRLVEPFTCPSKRRIFNSTRKFSACCWKAFAVWAICSTRKRECERTSVSSSVLYRCSPKTECCSSVVLRCRWSVRWRHRARQSNICTGRSPVEQSKAIRWRPSLAHWASN